MTGRPVLELEDLIVALRAFSPSGNRTNVISVSIDPTQQGLANMQQYLVGVMQGIAARTISASDDKNIAAGMREQLGLQLVSKHWRE